MKKVLFISNGFAEDLTAITIIKELKNTGADIEVSCLPIIGNAKHFKGLGIKVIGPHWEVPSEGLNYGSILLHLLDLLYGLPILILGQLFSLFIRRKKFDLVVTVGDFVNIAAAALARVRAPLFHVWICPSHEYPEWVKAYIKNHGVIIYPRHDNYEDLNSLGVPVRYVGNPLMDTFEITGEALGLDKTLPTIGVLPGSRKNVFKNLPVIVKALNLITKRKKANVLISVSPKLDMARLGRELYSMPEWDTSYIITERFGDVLNLSDIVIGLARTGNEQALCLGKPVVTFWGKGHSMSEEMVRRHFETIMNGNGILVPPDPEKIAESVARLLDAPEKMKTLSAEGKKIMGPRGASIAIARDLSDFLRSGKVNR